jgi:hypothetical protein
MKRIFTPPQYRGLQAFGLAGKESQPISPTTHIEKDELAAWTTHAEGEQLDNFAIQNPDASFNPRDKDFLLFHAAYSPIIEENDDVTDEKEREPAIWLNEMDQIGTFLAKRHERMNTVLANDVDHRTDPEHIQINVDFGDSPMSLLKNNPSTVYLRINNRAFSLDLENVLYLTYHASQTVHIARCMSKEELQEVVDFFERVWANLPPAPQQFESTGDALARQIITLNELDSEQRANLQKAIRNTPNNYDLMFSYLGGVFYENDDEDEPFSFIEVRLGDISFEFSFDNDKPTPFGEPHSCRYELFRFEEIQKEDGNFEIVANKSDIFKFEEIEGLVTYLDSLPYQTETQEAQLETLITAFEIVLKNNEDKEFIDFSTDKAVDDQSDAEATTADSADEIDN